MDPIGYARLENITFAAGSGEVLGVESPTLVPLFKCAVCGALVVTPELHIHPTIDL